MLISIIVPTLNEEANLPVTLRQLAQRTDVELIIVDGGSTDKTATIARQFTSYVFVMPPGRAAQMNAGARHATGDILLFLHADTFLLPGALDEMLRRITGDGAVGGAFDLNLDSPRKLMQLIAKISSRRARLFRTPTGDQAIFCWRQVFEEIGGYPDVPILEDVALARRLRRAGRLTFLRTGLVTSARRWVANGVLKTTLVNWWVAFLFCLRIPPRYLRPIYEGWFKAEQPRADKSNRRPPGKHRVPDHS